jgi:hypothetical protein
MNISNLLPYVKFATFLKYFIIMVLLFIMFHNSHRLTSNIEKMVASIFIIVIIISIDEYITKQCEYMDNVSLPTIQPPTIQPPTIQPPTIQPPTIQPPTIQPPTHQEINKFISPMISQTTVASEPESIYPTTERKKGIVIPNTLGRNAYVSRCICQNIENL